MKLYELAHESVYMIHKKSSMQFLRTMHTTLYYWLKGYAVLIMRV
mgnify:CR=1 FL=1